MPDLIRAMSHDDAPSQLCTGLRADATGMQITDYLAGSSHADQVRGAEVTIDLTLDDDNFRLDLADYTSAESDGNVVVVIDRRHDRAMNHQSA